MIDQLRREVVQDVMNIKSISASWPTWIKVIRRHLDTLTPDGILNLGDHLSEVFFSTRGKGGRGQGSLSKSGTAWEGLVCWYLNLCLVGTSSIVFKKRSDTPKCILKALRVSYSNTAANSESDLIAVTFPTDTVGPPLEKLRRKNRADPLDTYAARLFDQLSVTVIQCKTNWNENAQIPMLWDIVYHARNFVANRIVVGSDNYSLRALRSFHYSFVTVPTSKLPIPGGFPVARVMNLSGGNYWGRPTVDGVAKSLKEIFAKAEIGPEDGRGLRASLGDALPRVPTDYDYFGL